MDYSVEQIATFIGGHAVLLFGCGLTLMLAITAALWWAVKRYGEKLWQCAANYWLRLVETPLFGALRRRVPVRVASWLHPLRPGGYLGLHAAIGFPVVLLAVLMFAGLADEIAAGEDLDLFDQALTAALQQALAADALQFFWIITHLGDVITLTVLGAAICLLLLLRGHWLLAAGWSLALAGNGILNKALKGLFQRVRPLHEHGLVLEQGWSFPSGHSSGALVAYGMLAYVLVRLTPRVWHLPVTVAAILLILLVGCSRIFLQVHYFSDVIAGYASGAAWLAVCIAGTEIAFAHRARNAR
jgi:membrane-associated phospholipid phosphatase